MRARCAPFNHYPTQTCSLQKPSRQPLRPNTARDQLLRPKDNFSASKTQHGSHRVQSQTLRVICTTSLPSSGQGNSQPSEADNPSSYNDEEGHIEEGPAPQVPSPDLGAFYLVWRRSWSEAAGASAKECLSKLRCRTGVDLPGHGGCGFTTVCG